ncbi:hypothetical protein P692DRAFT_20753870 [Suillus brevipes Sb2]|nr:hypothetical protein P692DRAFT_20753870 [Suillus brevipes Sb2]
MEPNISRFANYMKLHELIRVKLADNHVVLAPGWGIVRLTLRYEKTLIDRDFDFLHVPNLQCTLISVSCLVSERISFISSLSRGMLSADDGHGPPLAHVHPYNGLYLLDATYATGNIVASAMLVRSSSVALSLHTWH